MEASCVGKCGYGDKGRWVKYWVHLGCCISPRYGPFSLGARFETCEPFISLIFTFFSGCHKPWILNQRIQGHTCIYVCVFVCTRANRQLYHAQNFYSVNFYLSLWSQWCHQNYDKSCATNTTQSVSLHLTTKPPIKYFWQTQNITHETCSPNNCARLAVTHAKHNVKTSNMNTVTYHNQ
jgi:hypothetical protein